MGIPCLLEQLQYDKWSINAIYQRALDRNPIRRAAIRPLLAFSWAPCFSIHDNTQAACRVRCSLMRDGTQEQLWKLAFDTPPPKCALRNIPTPQSPRARRKWCRDPDGFAPPPAWIITGPKRERTHTSRSRRRSLSEQLEHAQDG